MHQWRNGSRGSLKHYCPSDVGVQVPPDAPVFATMSAGKGLEVCFKKGTAG